MPTPCPQDHSCFWQHALEPDAGLAEHVQHCSACRVRAQRAAQAQQLLQGLPRMRAPRELDGLVVAATQAGHRQERAEAQLSQLARLAAPEELAARVEAQRRAALAERPAAPAELEHRLAAELAAPQQAMAQRFLHKLERMRAPSDLEARLAARPMRAERRRTLSFAGALVVLLGLGSLAILRWNTPNPEAPNSNSPHSNSQGIVQAERRIQWEVEHVDSLEGFDPMARALMGGLSGGASDVLGKEKL